ncbi:DUF2085 domain-containing protein [Candidatus Bathyarchaeota archaeon]|nr:MAG: DUF2085 domain-containing protein [Candidatus Bathyarchaeota archaeon]TMI31272.1 MAG: DUF2085 domain-containing protein [Candidatus Bathyarchaeota archaeon]
MQSSPDERASLRFLLLAHHSVKGLSHTIRINLLGRTLYVCARCTGVVLGFLLGTLYTNQLMMGVAARPYLLAIFPIPAATDWLIQVHGLRESSNWRRVVTGVALGQSYLAGLVALLTGQFLLVIYAGLVWLMYAVILFTIFNKTNALQSYLRKSF